MSLHQSNSPRRFVRSRRRATTAETTSAVPSNVPPNLDFEAHIVHAAIGDLRPPEAKLLKNQAQVARGHSKLLHDAGLWYRYLPGRTARLSLEKNGGRLTLS